MGHLREGEDVPGVEIEAAGDFLRFYLSGERSIPLCAVVKSQDSGSNWLLPERPGELLKRYNLSFAVRTLVISDFEGHSHVEVHLGRGGVERAVYRNPYFH